MTDHAGTDRSDAQWIADLSAAGDRRDGAIAALRSLLLGGLRRSFRNGRGMEDATLEDVVQDTLLKVLDKLDTYRGASRFTTWSMSVAVHGALTELRHRRWRDVSLDRAAEDADLRPDLAVDPGLGVDRASDQNTVIDAMRAVIDRDLTDRQRRALLAAVGGMPLEEIARKLGSNRNAVYKLTFDARLKLRRGLERAGFAAEDVRSIFAF